jgi:hypothetical protein
MPISVHDNLVYAQAVDYGHRRIVLHTIYADAEPPEYTDVVFEGVIAHHFEQEQFGASPYGANILFDVEEAELKNTLGQNADLLARAKNYGWPMLEYETVEDLVKQLPAGGAKCFEVHASFGLSGFVIATSLEFRPRKSRAEVITLELKNPMMG